MSWREFRYFPPSAPRAAKGGIKAQSRQGNFGQNWWAKRWIAILEGFQIGARLRRGRSYARSGQVLNIRIEAGLVTARVQGSRPRPYDVEIRVKTLARADSAKLGNALAERALFAAKLLAGQMPQDIEQAFAAAGLSLFPGRLSDLHTECSCPDWSNPCKHIAAVYYLVGEEFDRDPFLIFKLRGVDRDRLIAALGADARGDEAADQTMGERRGRSERAEQAAEPTPSATQAIDPRPRPFWIGEELSAECFAASSAYSQSPPQQTALPKRLGNFPFWRGNERFLDALTPMYANAPQCARDALVGLRGEGTSTNSARSARANIRRN
jgi:uncharacterized Zn finger protein